LRIPPIDHRPVFDGIRDTGLVRELHVYNNIVPVGHNKSISTQHMGIGKNLLRYAENIAWVNGLTGISVITGEGVRDYYHRRGYKSIDTYAIKYFEWEFLQGMRYSQYSCLVYLLAWFVYIAEVMLGRI